MLRVIKPFNRVRQRTSTRNGQIAIEEWLLPKLGVSTCLVSSRPCWARGGTQTRHHTAEAYAQRLPDPDALAMFRQYEASGVMPSSGRNSKNSKRSNTNYDNTRRQKSTQNASATPQRSRSRALGISATTSSRIDAVQEDNRSAPDLRTIQRNWKIPTHKDYPNTDPEILKKLSIKGSLFSSIPEATEAFQTQTMSDRSVLATLELSIPALDIHSMRFQARGATRDTARIATVCLAAAELHSSGKLADILRLCPQKIDGGLAQEESEAKSEIVDYCARFGGQPEFVYDIVKPPSSHKSRGSGFRGSAPAVAVRICTVTFAAQDITASGRAKDMRTSEILACLDFKRQAEQWHAQHGQGPLQVKHALSLNLKNAKAFFDYLTITVPTTKFEVKMENCKSKPRAGIRPSDIVGVVTLNGKQLTYGQSFTKEKTAETAAYLAGALDVIEERPEILDGFLEALKDGGGQIVKPNAPVWLRMQPKCLSAMSDTLQQTRRFALAKREIHFDPDADVYSGRESRTRNILTEEELKAKSRRLHEEFETYQASPATEKMRTTRRQLPMNQYEAQVLSLVNNNPVSIVVGATGSGKTTQVPQIIFEDAIKKGVGAKCNIICTQPRRIAAISVAKRVADERNEPYQHTVGHHVRFDVKAPRFGGSITFCTTGILLQQLRTSADTILDGVTHLLLDEVHERDMQIDFLMIVLKRILAERLASGKSSIRIVLMSATLNTELFSDYFSSVGNEDQVEGCPSITVPGRTFPVKEFYLEDIQRQISATHGGQEFASISRDADTKKFLAYEDDFRRQNVPVQGERQADDEQEEITIDWKKAVVLGDDGQLVVSTAEDGIIPIPLVALTIAHIAKTTQEGAILVFLPGIQEITAVNRALQMNTYLGVDFSNSQKFCIDMLHSSLPANQMAVFDTMQTGRRKIILSTNIAETSVTITDVRYVVDTGKLREKQYSQSQRVTSLLTTWVSKSNSKQRAGRAGRVQDGNYYALFSRSRALKLKATGLPEMLRSDLQETCLAIKAQGFKDPVEEFLSEAIEAPSRVAIESTVAQLRKLGALDKDERLTPLGKVLSTMPVDPSLGKMILLGVIFRCLDPMIIIGAAAGNRDIFVSPLERRKEARVAKKNFTRDSGSDQMATINAFRQWREIRDKEGVNAANMFADANFLHHGGLKTLDSSANQIETVLADSGVIPRLAIENRFRGEIGHPRLNDNASSVPLIKTLLFAGNYPNIAVQQSGIGLRTAKDNFVMIHPSSVNFAGRGNDRDARAQSPIGTIMTFGSKGMSNDGSHAALRDTSIASVLVTLLFGGSPSLKAGKVILDSWLPVTTDRFDHLKMVGDFRAMLDRILLLAFQDLSKRGNTSSGFLADEPARATFAKGFVEVLENDNTYERGPSRPRGGYSSTQTSPHSNMPSELNFVGRSQSGGSGGGGRSFMPSAANGPRSFASPGSNTERSFAATGSGSLGNFERK